MEHERREDERARVSIEAWWEGLSGRHGARVSDISMGGCFIDTLGKADIGELIVFAIKKPDGRWLQLRGQVASTDPNVGFSLAYSYLTED
ncbi:MAG TPA: PilZ domain-containing protein, partial [Pyrinomonadaceae bacterium]|nr:PilZ domain-containing protein [Pyrinomonadaceae bacterium]